MTEASCRPRSIASGGGRAEERGRRRTPDHGGKDFLHERNRVNRREVRFLPTRQFTRLLAVVLDCLARGSTRACGLRQLFLTLYLSLHLSIQPTKPASTDSSS